MDQLTYTGTFLKEKNALLDLEAYEPSNELVEAVNLAIFLGQPLLLMGEPGCGKTRLAEAVAAELHKGKMDDHYFRWDIKSTSKAKDGLYQYDALKRMYDANTGDADVKDKNKYITYGKFAEALTRPQNGDIPNVLLIDEIDKADIDFPNDLLLEIEKGEFVVPELDNKKVKRLSKVVIFITSNRERELPPAFLRRCLYHYIKFPKLDDLVKIVKAKFPGNTDEALVENAVTLFLDVRSKIDGQFAESEKKPSTSELLEWFRVIDHYQDLKKKQALPDNDVLFIESIENYKKGDIDNIKIPFPQALLKTWESNQLFEAR